MAGAGLYNVDGSFTDINDTISGSPVYSAPNTVVTLTTGGLTVDAHIGDVLVVGGNSYSIVDNAAGTVTVRGDASGESGAVTISRYSTLQSAADQLYADQGSSAFTAAQTITIYAGTYTGNTILNANLKPVPEYRLVINVASGETVVLNNSGLTDNVLEGSSVYHVTIDGSAGSLTFTEATTSSYYCIRGDDGSSGTYAQGWRINKVAFTNTLTGGNPWGVAVMRDVLIEDCTFEDITYAVGTCSGTIEIRRCEYTECTFSVTNYILGDPCRVIASACVFDDCAKGLNIYQTGTKSVPPVPIDVRHCTFYSCDDAVRVDGSSGYEIAGVISRNNIFSGCTDCYDFADGMYIESVDWNAYYNNTNIGNVGGSTYTTIAGWQAFTGADGSAPDANSWVPSGDPLTSAATGNFELSTTQYDTLRRCPPCGIAEDVEGGGYADDWTAPGAYADSLFGVTPPTFSGLSASGTTVTAAFSSAGSAPYVKARLSMDGETSDTDTVTAGSSSASLTAPTTEATAYVSMFGVNADGEVITEPSTRPRTLYIRQTSRTWPATIPQYPASYSMQTGGAMLASPVSAGPAKRRERFRNQVDTYSVTLPPMTEAQITALLSFWENDCSHGTLAFVWINPRTGDEATLRFGEDGLTISPAEPGDGHRQTVSFSVELIG